VIAQPHQEALERLRVLAGFEVPPGDAEELERFLVGLGYQYERETENQA